MLGAVKAQTRSYCVFYLQIRRRAVDQGDLILRIDAAKETQISDTHKKNTTDQ